jgi:hypothetical protein
VTSQQNEESSGVTGNFDTEDYNGLVDIYLYTAVDDRVVHRSIMQTTENLRNVYVAAI